MKLFRVGAVVTVMLLTMVSAALACSACIKDVMTDSEFDRQSWDQSRHVFVALIVSAQLVKGKSEVRYKFKADEILKGDPNAAVRVYSSRFVREWNDESGLVGCGDITISVGDRILVFLGPGGIAHVGACSASRVIEGAAVTDPEPARRTLSRLREWKSRG